MIATNEYNPYYKSYIALTTSNDILEGLKLNLKTAVDFYKSIPLEKHDYAYAEGKWTIKDVLLHCIDCERIFAYRALRISRQDKTPLSGFEQDDYVPNANATARTMDSLLNEYVAVRQATIALFEFFTAEQLMAIGTASGSEISVRAIGYIFSGHENHHMNVVKERYL